MATQFPPQGDIQAWFRDAYGLLLAVAEDIVLRYRQEDLTFTEIQAKAKPSELVLTDIVAGSSARIGDVKLIVHASSIPPGTRRMEQKDRVLWRGREYAVVQYDHATPSIGGEPMAITIIVRG